MQARALLVHGSRQAQTHVRMQAGCTSVSALLRRPACCYTGFEKFNQVERARRYHDEMMQAGLVPRISALSVSPSPSHRQDRALQ